MGNKKYNKLVLLQNMSSGFECMLSHYEKLIKLSKENNLEDKILLKLEEGLKITQDNCDRAQNLLDEFIEENLNE